MKYYLAIDLGAGVELELGSGKVNYLELYEIIGKYVVI
jgi:hypothetical protein